MIEQEQKVGLDSQCLSYLIDAIYEVNCPVDTLSNEKVSLVKIWFYKHNNYYVTETVISEVKKIRDIERKELHEDFIRTLLLDFPVENVIDVNNRADDLIEYHNKRNDCLILAEAEELGLDMVLTYDNKFWERLRYNSNKTRLVKPASYWGSLKVPKGLMPITEPHRTSPLSNTSWWRH